MTAANSITTTAGSMISAAMQELGILAGGEMPSADDSAWVLQKLQRLIDKLNARAPMVYNVNFSLFTIPTNTQPIEIGPNAAFDVNQRPIDIRSASTVLILSSNPAVDVPINIRDQQWWADNRVKTLTSSYATDLYYSPDWPNGSIYLWPIPTQANQIRLEMQLVISQTTSFAQTFSMPPGYWDVIVYSLAEAIGPSFGREPTPTLLRLKAEAVKAVQVNNVASPRGTTGDAGMPGVGRRGDFNYYSGMPNQ